MEKNWAGDVGREGSGFEVGRKLRDLKKIRDLKNNWRRNCILRDKIWASHPVNH